MRIGIETWGSDGDILPFVALAGGLRSAGHDVTIAVTSVDDKDYSRLARALGLRLVRVVDKSGFDMVQWKKIADSVRSHARLMRMFFEAFWYPHVERMYEAAAALCRESDLVIGHFFMYPLRIAAAKSGLPYVSVVLCHGLVPTLYRPPLTLPDLGRAGNFIEWKVASRFFDRVVGNAFKTLWTREGLDAPRHVLPDMMYSDALNLVAVSRAFCEEPPDWKGRHRVCGFLNVPDAAEQWSMPSGLSEFLSSGEPPVYMTFGSSGQLIPDESAELMLDAARLAGVRALIQSLSAKRPPGTRDGNVYFVGRVPHSYVFPLCCAVVHHGGAGTTHAAARSGRPSVVVYFAGEQRFWGTELRRLGAAGDPLPVKRATPEKLARALRFVLDSPEIASRAAELGKAMHREDGVRNAVALIEGLAAHP